MIIGFVIFFLLAIWMIVWGINLPAHPQYIPYKRFKSMYAINPARWNLEFSSAEFKGGNYYTYDNLYIAFNPVMTLAFIHFRRQQTKASKLKRDTENMEKMIKTLQEDIRDFEARNRYETHLKLKEIWKYK